MRIAVVEQRGSGGMIHYAYQLCTALAEEGAEVTLITAEDYELEGFPHNFHVEKLMKLWSLTDPLLTKPPKNRLEAFGRAVFWISRRAFRAVRLVIQWFHLTKYIARSKPDIVLFGQMKFSFEALFMRRLKRKGLFLSQICHEFELRDTGSSWFSQLETRLYFGIFSLLSVIFVHGEFNRERFLAMFPVPRERVYSIRHGNEMLFARLSKDQQTTSGTTRNKYMLAPDEKVVLFFGNITPSKGVEDLIKAFKFIRAKHGAVRLLIAGSPAVNMSLNKLHQLTRELGLNESVLFDIRYIPIHEVGELMSLATVVIYPYRTISQSGALQVAYAFGKPVVATRVGGFPESVDEKKNGYLVNPESPEELSEAVLKILNDPGLAEAMGKLSRVLAETRFAWRPIAREILDTLHAIRK